MSKTTVIRCLCFVLFVVAMLAVAPRSVAQIAVGVAVNIEPPELPVYDQPVCPGDDYLWTPGYWAWDPDAGDYYWVPGTWVLAPEPGFFWTPGYWGWRDTGYFWNAGYWGPVVGFYGGIDYGFGYWGHGYDGGRWDHGHFFYNTAVSRVNVTIIHNTYVDRSVIVNRTENRVSFNGGRGGIDARPTAAEEAAGRERHVGPVEAQTRNMDAARSNREFRASVNHGAPPVAATPRAGEFKGNGVVKTREAGTVHTEARPISNVRPEAGRPGNEPRTSEASPNGGRPNAIHPNELPPAEKMTAPNTGNSKLDQKYQKQQDKLAAQQAKERQNLQQQQEKEHAQAARQNANEAQKQQMEQRHQQQTQQLQQRHQQQQQNLQKRQAPPPRPAEPPRPRP
jgi:hypothetical protein